MKIAQRFNAGTYAAPDKVPKGWQRPVYARPSLRDSNSIDHNPGVETPGYYRNVLPGHIAIEFPKGSRAGQRICSGSPRLEVDLQFLDLVILCHRHHQKRPFAPIKHVREFPLNVKRVGF